MYSPIIHSEISIIPPINVSVHIIDVHPGVMLFNLSANDNIAYISIIIDITTESIPNPPTNFSGLIEKLNIPSAASLSIFFNGYFVVPANLSFLSYSRDSCLNPVQLNKPLKNLLCSGNELITSITFLSASLKSPVSFGISISDNLFKV